MVIVFNIQRGVHMGMSLLASFDGSLIPKTEQQGRVFVRLHYRFELEDAH